MSDGPVLRAARPCPVSRQTPLEELINGLLHGAGALACVAGTAVLVVLASRWGTAWQVVGVSVFGAALVGLYAISTLYHSAWSPRWKRALQVADHMAIYVLIAGSYTPFALGPLRGGWGWSLLGVVWGLAAAGIALKVFFTGRAMLLSTALYVGMGWLALVAIVPLARALPFGGLALLAAGGLAYTAGAVFYAWDGRVRFFHAVFHGLALAGSGFHFWAVLAYVVRPA